MKLRYVGAAITFSLMSASACAAQVATPAHGPAQVYAATCHFCHDTGIGPPIKGAHYPPGRIRFVVRHGDGAMIAFTPSRISDAELTALIAWLEKPLPQMRPAGAHP